MRRNAGILVLLLFPAFLLADEPARELPFQPGEILNYDLKWGLFPVGSATMKVLPKEDEGDDGFHRLSFSVRTNEFADAFYKVRTNITSVVDRTFSKSMRYEKSQKEGKTKREIEVLFDYDAGKANYFESGRLVSTLPIPSQVLDPLSIAYFFRLGELKAETETTLPTCDGRKLKMIKVRTGKTEKIRVPAGTYKAMGTIPEMKDLSGVFKKSPEGILRIWYSADSRKIPVRISSKVVVGSFTARLVSAEGLKEK